MTKYIRNVIHYLSQGAVFTALIIILNYFEDKRRNSKKKR